MQQQPGSPRDKGSKPVLQLLTVLPRASHVWAVMVGTAALCLLLVRGMGVGTGRAADCATTALVHSNSLVVAVAGLAAATAAGMRRLHQAGRRAGLPALQLLLTRHARRPLTHSLTPSSGLETTAAAGLCRRVGPCTLQLVAGWLLVRISSSRAAAAPCLAHLHLRMCWTQLRCFQTGCGGSRRPGQASVVPARPRPSHSRRW